MTTIAPDRRTFLKTLGVAAAAGLGTLAIAPRASAADDVVLPTTYRTLRVADPAGSTLSGSLPSHHWLGVDQVATYCAGRGYFW